MLSTKSTSAEPPAWRAISASSTCPRSTSIATGGFMQSCSARQQYRRYGIRHTDCWMKKRAKSPEPHASRRPETYSNGWHRLRGITEDFVDFLRLRENKPLFTQVAARASETRANPSFDQQRPHPTTAGHVWPRQSGYVLFQPYISSDSCIRSVPSNQVGSVRERHDRPREIDSTQQPWQAFSRLQPRRRTPSRARCKRRCRLRLPVLQGTRLRFG